VPTCKSGWMRKGIEVRLGPGDRERLEAITGSGNSPQKHVWRARIVLLSADGIGTMGKGKPTIWRWQARFMAEGVDGLLHEATRPAGKPALPAATVERVIEMTLADPPGETTHWTCRAMAKAAGVSHRRARSATIRLPGLAAQVQNALRHRARQRSFPLRPATPASFPEAHPQRARNARYRRGR
jgi:Homeodomain-like domain